MNWTGMLNSEIDSTYKATLGLLDLVEDGMLSWKPSTGSNWMSTAQLLMHITTACGFCCKGFVTGDWGCLAEMDPSAGPPPAEKMPALESVAQAREMLLADQKLAREMVAQAGEENLANKETAAPWCPQVSSPLGLHLLQMIGHLAQHKAQLFYYLKLMGKDVNTGHLYGM